MGIEPTYSAWEADVLPLNYTRIKKLESIQISGIRKTPLATVCSISYFGVIFVLEIK